MAEPLRAPRPQTCWTCNNALFGSVTFCPVFGEVIDSEVLAGSDCPAYTEDLTGDGAQ